MRLEIACHNAESGEDQQSLGDVFRDWSIDVQAVAFS
jgi:hypothetical protein